MTTWAAPKATTTATIGVVMKTKVDTVEAGGLPIAAAPAAVLRHPLLEIGPTTIVALEGETRAEVRRGAMTREVMTIEGEKVVVEEEVAAGGDSGMIEVETMSVEGTTTAVVAGESHVVL